MEPRTEAVELERVRRDATCIIIRVGLGSYTLGGPRDNILTPESRVAWATVVHDLEGEGYRLVGPEEYARATGLTAEQVVAGIHREGNLFAVVYGAEVVLPLPEKEALLPPIEVLAGS